MATLEKIRNRAGLLVSIIIGLALLAFVLGDMLNSGGSMFSKSQYEIAKVAGKSIPYNDFQEKIDNFIEINKIQSGRSNLDESTLDNIRNVSWEYMIEELIMSDEYEKLGITVTGDELMDMIQGENPHPIIRQVFSDPQTGMLNKSFMFDFIQRTLQEEDSERKKFWFYIEDEIFRQRRLAKYTNLIKKGLYVNSLQAKRRGEEISKTVDIDFVVRPFTSVPDSIIKISEKEVRAFYKDHLARYRQEESRDLKYVVYEVKPSPEDYRIAEDWINKIHPEFVSTKETRQFVNLQSDVPFEERNYMKDDLSDTIADFMFEAQEGDVYGPYFENNAYKLAKLAKIDYLPDSVKARHILLQVSQENYAQASALADSLKKMIENGADFAELARQNSSDGSAQEGGDLGWFREGEMVKPFSDTCFYGQTGDVKLVYSQFGIHIVEVLAQSKEVKKVQVGILVRNVEPSEETDQEYYRQASEFAGLNNTGEKFNKAIQANNLVPQYAPGLKPLEKNIPGLVSPRQLVKWAYNADENEVSNVMKFDNKYVVALVENVKEEGYADIEDIRPEIELEIGKQKKAEIIAGEMKDKISSSKSIDELASKLTATSQTATNITFSTRSIENAGIEPNITAAACTLDEGLLSGPITGNNGVYVIAVTNSRQSENIEMLMEREKLVYERNYTSRANYAAYEALKKKAEVVDNRAKFF
ncbi:MAG: SurA N-terminal domain-containing protein [Bacteroidales bacterium]|nr:SurA N-terminal domain-containing protein [Bacteroidales bacterium]